MASCFPVQLLAAVSLGFIACVPPEAPPTEAALPKSIMVSYGHFRLSNGLEVVLHEDHSRPIVATRLTVLSGSAAEPADKRGLAHLVEHLMFARPKSPDGKDYRELLDEAGAWGTNGQTDQDTTAYFTNAPRDALPRVLFVEAWRLTHHEDEVDDERVERERVIVKSENSLRFENARLGNLPAIISTALWPPGHPYRKMPGGTDATVDAITRADERAFFEKHYGANNLVLVVAGDFVSKDVEALIARDFSALPSGPAREVITPAPAVLSREQMLHVDADVGRDQVMITWPLPPAHDPDALRIQVAANYLRRRDQVEWSGADQENVSIFSGLRGGWVTFSMQLPPSTSAADALQHFDRTLDTAKGWDSTANAEAFARTHAMTLASGLFVLDEFGARAASLSYGLIDGFDPDFAADRFLIVQAMTTADARARIDQYFPSDRRIVTFVHVDPNAPRSGRLRSANPPLEDAK